MLGLGPAGNPGDLPRPVDEVQQVPVLAGDFAVDEERLQLRRSGPAEGLETVAGAAAADGEFRGRAPWELDSLVVVRCPLSVLRCPLLVRGLWSAPGCPWFVVGRSLPLRAVSLDLNHHAVDLSGPAGGERHFERYGWLGEAAQHDRAVMFDQQFELSGDAYAAAPTGTQHRRRVLRNC